MPGYTTHIAGGLVVAVLGIALIAWLGHSQPSPLALLLMGFLLLLGAIFPDIDTDSKAQNLFYGILVLVDLVLILKEEFRAAALLGFAALLPSAGRHRGWTHTWWAMVLLPAPIILVPLVVFTPIWTTFVPFYLAAVLGYCSHLVLDRTL